MDLFRYKQWNIVGKRGLFYLLSVLVTVVALVLVFSHGLQISKAFNLGIDFTGGSQYVVGFPQQIATNRDGQIQVISEARQALEAAGIKSLDVQVLGSDALQIRTDGLTNEAKQQQEDQLLTQLSSSMGSKYGQPSIIQSELVGPVIGSELARKAVWALLIGFALQLAYIGIRYTMPGSNGLRFGLTAVVALIHDVFLLLGLVIVLKIQINSWFVASLLTVVGYSINDSVIIFDRIRENLKNKRREPFDRVVNASLLQTMARSVNTVMTTEFALVAIWLFGGESLQPFALTLAVGMLTGTYSSIFIASPLVVSWRLKDEKKLNLRTPDGRPICVSLAASEGKVVESSMTLEYAPEEVVVASEEEEQGEETAATSKVQPGAVAKEQAEKKDLTGARKPKRARRR